MSRAARKGEELMSQPMLASSCRVVASPLCGVSNRLNRTDAVAAKVQVHNQRRGFIYPMEHGGELQQ